MRGDVTVHWEVVDGPYVGRHHDEARARADYERRAERPLRRAALSLRRITTYDRCSWRTDVLAEQAPEEQR